MDAGANSLFLKIEYLLDCYENETERQSIRNAKRINLTRKELTEKINNLYRQLPKQSGNDTPEYRSLESRVKHMNDRESSTWRAFKASASSTKSALDKQLIQAAKNIELEKVLPEIFRQGKDLSHVSLRVLQQIYDISKNPMIKEAIDQRIRDMTQVSLEIHRSSAGVASRQSPTENKRKVLDYIKSGSDLVHFVTLLSICDHFSETEAFDVVLSLSAKGGDWVQAFQNHQIATEPLAPNLGSDSVADLRQSPSIQNVLDFLQTKGRTLEGFIKLISNFGHFSDQEAIQVLSIIPEDWTDVFNQHQIDTEPSAPPLEVLGRDSEILLGQEFNRVFSEYPLTQENFIVFLRAHDFYLSREEYNSISSQIPLNLMHLLDLHQKATSLGVGSREDLGIVAEERKSDFKDFRPYDALDIQDQIKLKKYALDPRPDEAEITPLLDRVAQSQLRVEVGIERAFCSAEEALSQGVSLDIWKRYSAKEKLDHIIKYGTFTRQSVRMDVLEKRVQLGCAEYIVDLLRQSPVFSSDIGFFVNEDRMKKAISIGRYFEFLRIKGYPDIPGSYEPETRLNAKGTVDVVPVQAGIDMRSKAYLEGNRRLKNQYLQLAGSPVKGTEITDTDPVPLNIAEYVQIKGDGACYYRSTYVGAIESYIVHPQRVQLFQNLIEKLEKLTQLMRDDDLPEADIQGHLMLIDMLKLARDNRIWETPDLFAASINQIGSRLDQCFIRAMKYLLVDYLRDPENLAHQGPSGLDLRTAIEAGEEGGLEGYISIIKDMRRDAEGAIIHLGVLFSLMGLAGGLIDLNVTPMNVILQQPDGSIENPPKVFLRLSSGHYDLFRTQEFVNQRDAKKNLQ